jgi:hypothetical protein
MAPRLDDRSPTPTNDEMDNKSDCSDGMFNRSVRSSSENHLVGTYQDESGNRVSYCLKQFALSQTLSCLWTVSDALRDLSHFH